MASINDSVETRPRTTEQTESAERSAARSTELASNNGLGSLTLTDVRSAMRDAGNGGSSNPADVLRSSNGDDLVITGLDSGVPELRRVQGGRTRTQAERTERARPAENRTDDSEAVSIVGRPKKFDPSKPTVVVLDDLRDDKVEFMREKGAVKGPTHGEITARAAEHRGAEQDGFNVFRVHMNENASQLEVIQGLEKKIKSGEIPLGRGDAITMSFGGTHDATFKAVSQFLGTEINAANLKDKRDEILAAFREKSQDPSLSPELREGLANAVAMNDTISRIQKDTGADVIHASGNTGADRFSLQFMTANIQLRSSDKDGKVDNFSADHSLTNAAGDGVFGVKFNAKTNTFEVSNESVTNPIKFQLREIGKGKPVERFLGDRSQTEFKLVEKEDRLHTSLALPTAVPGDKRNVVAVVAGTSFANISFLERYRPAMLAAKRGERDM